MKPARALAVFTVGLRGRKLHVRVLPTAADVDSECHKYEGRRQRGAPRARAFFAPSARRGVAGIIVLPADGRLTELVPHEVVHAVLDCVGGVTFESDEAFATTVGRITAQILRQIAHRGIEVTP